MRSLPEPGQLQECFPLADLIPSPRRTPRPEYLSAEEYASLGLKCGVEVHQQLLTAGKLFCRCPARRYSTDHHASVLRHMRPTLSELGEYDGTALMEFKTKKNIVYMLNRETVCTYEMDDTPPFPMDQRALQIAIEIALILRCRMVSEIHIARKQYLDGSIPTGFQRTSIVGVEGAVPFGDRVIRIIQLGLEEDACREVSDRGHWRHYRTDRLGMPLIETVTYPELFTPWEAVWFGQVHRLLLRSTGKVRRGIGAARQDVNVSIAGGRRVEIKGVERIPLWGPLIHYEAMRQKGLLTLKDELTRRARPADWLTSTSRIEPAAASGLLPPEWDDGHPMAAVALPAFRGLLSWPLGGNRTFASELSDRVRVVACIDQPPNLIHSDVEPNAWRELRDATRAGEEDALVLLSGDGDDLVTACREVRDRCLEAWDGVPSETRQVAPDGTTRFERILPGPDRMYPDTDLPPMEIPPERIEAVRNQLPPSPWELASRFHAAGLSTRTSGYLARRRDAGALGRVLLDDGRDLSECLIQSFLPMWDAGGGRDERTSRRVLSAADDGVISPKVMPDLFTLLASRPCDDPLTLAREHGLAMLPPEEIKTVVVEEKAEGDDDGLFIRVMRRLGSRAQADTVLDILEDLGVAP
ncbi:MAG: Glu-tRNA(Gln) amidotransferase subunit GatE [Candidatus Eisenbacteria bacterium]|jgi:glutamyl-tRNA(Gln) amidotransferase subunit E|nr:Glu-tRNA(Gln) amidotransferase subunit GatE [Candidatus Eisenbacteria bacterium]